VHCSQNEGEFDLLELEERERGDSNPRYRLFNQTHNFSTNANNFPMRVIIIKLNESDRREKNRELMPVFTPKLKKNCLVFYPYLFSQYYLEIIRKCQL
jgi:hypothetical protein